MNKENCALKLVDEINSYQFISMIAKFRKATVSFVMSVRPPVRLFVRPSFRTKQLGSHWMDFHEIWYLSIFRKSFVTIQVSLKSNKNNGYLHEDPHTFLIISHSFLLRMWHVSDKFVNKIKTHVSCSKTCFLNRAAYEKMWRNIVRVGHATDDNMVHAHCMLDSEVYKHILRICNTFCFSPATVVARMRLSVPLCTHNLSCYVFKVSANKI